MKILDAPSLISAVEKKSKAYEQLRGEIILASWINKKPYIYILNKFLRKRIL